MQRLCAVQKFGPGLDGLGSRGGLMTWVSEFEDTVFVELDWQPRQVPRP